MYCIYMSKNYNKNKEIAKLLRNSCPVNTGNHLKEWQMITSVFNSSNK